MSAEVRMNVLECKRAIRAAQLMLESAMSLPDSAEAEVADFLNRAALHLRMASALHHEWIGTGQVKHDLDKFTPEGNERP
jgi:hypothetical protein